MKKFTYIILTLIIIAGGYYFYDLNKKQAIAPENLIDGQYKSDGTEIIPKPLESKNNDGPQVAMPSPSPTQGNVTEGTFSSGEGNVDGGSNVQVVEVIFDGKGFNPNPLSIKVNDWVFFKNASDSDLWVASDPHPSHTGYAGFDSKKKVTKGSTYKFEFTKAGTFGYHNHLNPSQSGSITVK